MPKTLPLPFLCSAVVAILLVLSSSQRLAAQTDPEAGLRKYAENPIQSWEDVDRINKQIDPIFREYGEKPIDSGKDIKRFGQEDVEKIQRQMGVSKDVVLGHVVGLLGGILLLVVTRLLIGKTGFQALREKLKKVEEQVKNRPEIVFVWPAGIIAAWARRAKGWITSSTTRKADQEVDPLVQEAAARLVGRESAGGGLKTEAQKSVWDDWNEDSTPKILP